MAEKLFNHITYQEGQGKQVVFIHGIEDDGTFWFPVDRAVAKFRHVITIDLLGFGKSPQGGALSYTLAEHVGAIKNTLDREIPEGKITLVAHSLGCYTALEFAKRYPDRVERLILSSPVVIFKHNPIKPKDFLEGIQNFFLNRIHLFRTAALKQAEKSTAPAGIKKLVHDFWPSIKNVETLVEDQDVPHQLSMIERIPILINYGAIDPLVINSNIETLVKYNSKIKMVKFGAGHDLVHTKAIELFKEIVPEAKDTEIPPVILEKLKRK